jgi:HD-like signal output (HDOD) protein/CheY-like chemotaxis protein
MTLSPPARTGPERRVLFVDDEPNVLAGLQRMLRPMRQEWDMHFAQGGAEALAALADRPFEIVVTDMRMPGIDGAALLEEVSRAYPRVIRIVLSGQANREAILRVVGPAHQYLAKPCDAEELKTKLQRLFALGDLLADDTLKSSIAKLRSLPSVPGVRLELTEIARSEGASLAKIGRIVERNLAITAKLLQWVNSGFFGMRARVASADQALKLLGLDLVRELMLSSELAHEIDVDASAGFRLDKVWRRSVAMRSFVSVIARVEGLGPDVTVHAATAAMLHDVGRLALACCIPDHYRVIVAEAIRERKPLVQVEQEALGCTHADVGAYLLGLWGLPDETTAAVAGHHRPVDPNAAALTPLMLVHAAAAIVSELMLEPDDELPDPVAPGYFAGLGTRPDFERWKKACAVAIHRGSGAAPMRATA